MGKQNHSILIVDDDDDDLNMLTGFLKAIDNTYDIYQVHNGVEALLELKEMEKTAGLPSLIIMDINMPKMDGKQSLIAIQADKGLSLIPVIIFSTSACEVDKYFFKIKNVDMITKPDNIKEYNQIAAKLLSYCRN